MTTSGIHEEGAITKVLYDKDDHGILTIVVYAGAAGWAQSFGGLAFKNDAEAADFAKSLCETFDVARVDALVGKPCAILRCFAYDSIEALVAPSGKMFVITEWRHKHYPGAPGPLEQKRRGLEERIEVLRRQIHDAKMQLARLDSEYHPVRP